VPGLISISEPIERSFTAASCVQFSSAAATSITWGSVGHARELRITLDRVDGRAEVRQE
jgi:hypothetical protein